MPVDKLSGLFKAGYSNPDRNIQVSDYLQQGVKYSKFATTYTDSDSAILNRNAMINGAKTYSESIGDRVYFVTYHDENGKVIKCPISGDNGEIELPDNKGRYRRINDAWLDAELETSRAVEDRVDRQMKDIVDMTDNTVQIAMGYTKAEYDSLFGSNGSIAGMQPEMAKFDCHLNVIRGLPTGSILQTQALSKLRYIVRERPITIHRSKVNPSKDSKNTDKDGSNKKAFEDDVPKTDDPKKPE